MANAINEHETNLGHGNRTQRAEGGQDARLSGTPVNASLGKSIAKIASALPKIALPANVGKQLLQRRGLGRFER